ncbi:hypothetical protein IQ241_22875 [Romeria aff. gracilis LEGE 07310]|uniref:Uncharacterized protein n=1 Tax=Vasconcelosia minhoensis LEGE 07310 TaxID=915328 RepID=A0A8J7ATA6_9CYAN|nr:hypothetical protein [Romeria gracilis]MBE9080100.1 hypothetical protein [Romeria aff. gracilis LEGE 07310]
MSLLGEHPLSGWVPNEQSFDNDIGSNTETLERLIDINRAQLDFTLDSLNAISAYIHSLESNANIGLELFLPLTLYFGEVIRQSVKGSWQLKMNQDIGVYEPWVKYESPSIPGATTALPPHFALNKELERQRSCNLKLAAEEIVQQLIQSSSPKPSRRLGFTNQYEDGSILVLKPGFFLQTDDLITPEVYAVAEQWLIETINYFSKFGFFEEYEDTSISSLQTRIGEIKKSFEDRFISGQSLDEFYLEFVDVDSIEMPPVTEPVKKTRFLARYLLRLDTNRVWSNYEIPKVLGEEIVPLKALQGWSRVSRGLLHIEDQDNTSLEKRRWIKIRIGTSQHVLPINNLNELDYSILDAINVFLKAERLPYQFYLYSDSLPEEEIIIMFSEAEKKQLRKDKMFSV